MAGGEHVVSACVVDAGDGPQVCTLVLMSDPPQGGGPPVLGWSWEDVRHQRSGDVRWGDYVLYGTWDGEALTLTRPPVDPIDLWQRDPDDLPRELRAAVGLDWEEHDDDFRTACAPPPGGWRVPASDDAAERRYERASTLAGSLDNVGSVWVDEAYEDDDEPGSGLLRRVLNVRVAGGEPERAEVERRLRAVYDGDLCVVGGARHSERELLRISEELGEEWADQPLISWGPHRDAVEVQVFFDDGALQGRADATWGVGAVRVLSVLRRVPG